MNGSPLISVVIIGWTRREFLMDAVRSVVDQTLPRDEYEILVIKNFADRAMDAQMREEGVILIETDDTSYGGKLSMAFRKARGSIICPLDDDDSFERPKLEVIKEVFSTIKGPCFYWNQRTTIDDKGIPVGISGLEGLNGKLRTPLLVLHPEDTGKFNDARIFNASSMALSRSIIENHLHQLHTPWNGDDMLFVCSAVADKATMVIDSRRLTRYRIHQAQVSSWIGGRKFQPRENSGISYIQKRIEILTYCLPVIEGTSLHYEFEKSIKRLRFANQIYFSGRRNIGALSAEALEYMLSRSLNDLLDIFVLSGLAILYLFSPSLPRAMAKRFAPQ